MRYKVKYPGLRTAFLILSLTITAFSMETEQSVDVKRSLKEASNKTRAGLFAEAENILRAAINADDKRSDAKVELAYVLTKQRRLGEAYDIVLPIVQSEPKNARALAVLGSTMLTGGRFREARLLFFNSIKLDRRQHLAWAGYGLLDFYENRINDSVENLRESVYYAPDEPDYLFALAQVSARAEKYKEAADAYRDFLSVSNSADADRRARIRGLINFLRYLGNAGTLYRVGGAEKQVFHST
ncbi:MAG: tetratricopeptide repeat protein [Acidobacteria bacterium]|nr:tetratricopeptide repeat protein [Acidobacteriota bacterium]